VFVNNAVESHLHSAVQVGQQVALIYVGPDLYRDMDLGIGNVSKKMDYQENLDKTMSLCFGLESGHSGVNTFLKSIYGRNLARII